MGLRERAFPIWYDAIKAPAERSWLGERRARVCGDAVGAVLEIGGGTGANLPHYLKADRVVVTEPSGAMSARLSSALDAAAVPVTMSAAPAERLPYPDESFDTVVATLVLCSVPDPAVALTEVKRVLRPGGEFRFLEHVRGEGTPGEWQDRIAPLWRWIAVGCMPNRDLAQAIGDSGLEIVEIERFAPPGPNWPVSPMIQGRARR